MTDINTVIVSGRLTKDAELKQSAGGKPYARFSLAVNKSRKDGNEWKDETSFLDAILWNYAEEACKKCLHKGERILLEGEIRQRKYEKDGKQYSQIVLVADRVLAMNGKHGEGAPNSIAERKKAFENAPYESKKSTIDDDKIPF